MVYAPPLIRPPLPPLRPPVAPPYRPPVLAPPPTQIDPGYEPPTLLPPTDIDLKGIVCIYSNAPIWEPKKIRYRYPGENWKEIAGDRYTTHISNIAGGNDLKTWVIDVGSVQISSGIILYQSPTRPCTNPLPAKIYTTKNIYPSFFTGKVVNVRKAELTVGNCGDIVADFFSGDWLFIDYVDSSNILRTHLISTYERIPLDPPYAIRKNRYFTYTSHDFSLRLREEGKPPPPFPCIFKVFDIFNQEILSITRDDCPEVIVVPERCYFKAENEKLVRKINVSFFQDLEIKYNGNCATVLLKSYPLSLPVEIYKECSDNPNCPPPRIRFDKKCEEKCEQCPPGTAIKVLLGSRIACVDAVGCVLKSIKYKPGCNNYDCICS